MKKLGTVTALACAGVWIGAMCSGCERSSAAPQLMTVECVGAEKARLELPGRAAVDLVGAQAVAQFAAPVGKGVEAVSAQIEFHDGALESPCSVNGIGLAARVLFLVPAP